MTSLAEDYEALVGAFSKDEEQAKSANVGSREWAGAMALSPQPLEACRDEFL